MRPRIQTIEDVVERQLCTGCGVCAYVEKDRFMMIDAEEFGKRPVLRDNPTDETGAAFQNCPGHLLQHTYDPDHPLIQKDLSKGWGPIMNVWEGHATDADIRFNGSSGGAATALAAFAICSKEYSGVLHTSSQKNKPFLNETVYSRTLNDLSNTTGSRYSPASPCERLDLIAAEGRKSVFIGKPCDVAAVQKLRQTDPVLDEKIGITIGFFCAGTPSTKATKELIKKVGVADSAQVTNLRYRGRGWPGNWQVTYLDGNTEEYSTSLTYAKSWGFLQKYRQWRCYICPDHTGEFADISVGDPWYMETAFEELGKSLIIARTEKGKKFILDAVAAGYIQLDSMDNTLLPRSQPNLLNARGALWGRLLTLRLFGAAVPNFEGFETFQFWISELTLKEKAQSIYGTAKRVFTKRLTKRISIQNDLISRKSQK